MQQVGPDPTLRPTIQHLAQRSAQLGVFEVVGAAVGAAVGAGVEGDHVVGAGVAVDVVRAEVVVDVVEIVGAEVVVTVVEIVWVEVVVDVVEIVGAEVVVDVGAAVEEELHNEAAVSYTLIPLASGLAYDEYATSPGDGVEQHLQLESFALTTSECWK